MEIPKGRGVVKAKLLEEKYEAKLEFPGGWGGYAKKPSVGEYGYFLELHNSWTKLNLFPHDQNIFEDCSKAFGNLWKSADIFANLHIC